MPIEQQIRRRRAAQIVAHRIGNQQADQNQEYTSAPRDNGTTG
jgi:hypothetical protein